MVLRFAHDTRSVETLRHHQPDPYANRVVAKVVKAHGYGGRFLGGDIVGLGWIATQDLDGQIEISFSYAHRRPNNWEIQKAFTQFGMAPFKEESKATGKVRHYVVQRGTMQ